MRDFCWNYYFTFTFNCDGHHPLNPYYFEQSNYPHITLLGDFHYLHYGLEWKRVAIALLKKDGKLIMGEGEQRVYLNIPYFEPDRPLRFDTVKFVFQKTISAN